MPTSGEINRAIETLRAAGAADAVLLALDGWNTDRLLRDAAAVSTPEQHRALFDGIPAETLARAGIT